MSNRIRKCCTKLLPSSLTALDFFKKVLLHWCIHKWKFSCFQLLSPRSLLWVPLLPLTSEVSSSMLPFQMPSFLLLGQDFLSYLLFPFLFCFLTTSQSVSGWSWKTFPIFSGLGVLSFWDVDVEAEFSRSFRMMTVLWPSLLRRRVGYLSLFSLRHFLLPPACFIVFSNSLWKAALASLFFCLLLNISLRCDMAATWSFFTSLCIFLALLTKSSMKIIHCFGTFDIFMFFSIKRTLKNAWKRKVGVYLLHFPQGGKTTFPLKQGVSHYK